MPASRLKSGQGSRRGRRRGGDVTERDAIRLNDGISAQVPDWSRERKALWEWNPSRALIGSIRSYQHHQAQKGIVATIARKLAGLRHRFWSVVTGADIPLVCRIGGGLLMPHPNGIVVHADAVIGPNCLLMQQVTIGTRNSEPPMIGGHVDVGAGAKILGAVKIGDHAQIGANALVIHDVPDFGVAMAPLAVIRAAKQAD